MWLVLYAKAQLLSMEQRILRAIRFKMALIKSQPYTYLFSVLQAIRAKSGLVDTAISVMNDLAAFSTLLIDITPLQLAVACTHVASHLLEGIDVQSDMAESSERHSASVQWYEAIGVSQADVEAIGHKIVDVLSSARAAVRPVSQGDKG